MSVRWYAWWVLGLFAACEKPPEPVASTPPPVVPVLPQPLCDGSIAPATAVAEWRAADGCPMWLSVQGQRLHLAGSSRTPVPVVEGEPPLCRVAACRYEGVQTALGPMIVATEPGAQSEVPVAVHVGFVLGMRTLVFVDLWAAAGDTVVEDATMLGPAHALSPMRCGAKLGLFARARLPAGERLEPPPELLARQGMVDLGKPALALEPGSPAGCEAITLPLP